MRNWSLKRTADRPGVPAVNPLLVTCCLRERINLTLSDLEPLRAVSLTDKQLDGILPDMTGR